MILWFAILFFNVADWVLTYYAITQLGAIEVKPPLTWLMKAFGITGGLWAMLGVKVTLQLVLLPLARWTWWVVLAAMVFVCLWNAYQVLYRA